MIKGIQYDAETGETTEVELDIVLPNPRILEIQERQREIVVMLAATDYKTLKYAEGSLSESEWTDHKIERQALRDESNVLETELAALVPEATTPTE